VQIVFLRSATGSTLLDSNLNSQRISLSFSDLYGYRSLERSYLLDLTDRLDVGKVRFSLDYLNILV
jgi:hypothetical protein